MLMVLQKMESVQSLWYLFFEIAGRQRGATAEAGFRLSRGTCTSRGRGLNHY